MTKLVHFTSKRDEYLALLEDDDDLEEYREPGYSVSSISGLMEVEGKISRLPTGRTFKEEA